MNKKIYLIIVCIFLYAYSVQSIGNNYVSDPANCPMIHDDFGGQSCDPDNICGRIGGTAQCYETSTISPPGSNAISPGATGTTYGGFNGGFVIDCFAIADTEAPYCDNGGSALCSKASTCNTNNRKTTCIGGKWQSDSDSYECGNCMNDYNDCDGDGGSCEVHDGIQCAGPNTEYDGCMSGEGNCVCKGLYEDCDGDMGGGCEILPGESCTMDNGLQGTCNGCGDTGKDANNNECNCQLGDPVHFLTGILAAYWADSPTSLLWGLQFGTGALINITKNDGVGFMVTNDGIAYASDFCIGSVCMGNIGASIGTVEDEKICRGAGTQVNCDRDVFSLQNKDGFQFGNSGPKIYAEGNQLIIDIG